MGGAVTRFTTGSDLFLLYSSWWIKQHFSAANLSGSLFRFLGCSSDIKMQEVEVEEEEAWISVKGTSAEGGLTNRTEGSGEKMVPGLWSFFS